MPVRKSVAFHIDKVDMPLDKDTFCQFFKIKNCIDILKKILWICQCDFFVTFIFETSKGIHLNGLGFPSPNIVLCKFLLKLVLELILFLIL